MMFVQLLGAHVDEHCRPRRHIPGDTNDEHSVRREWHSQQAKI